MPTKTKPETEQEPIDARFLYDIVKMALECRRPENNMKLNPRSAVVKGAKLMLEKIIQAANRGWIPEDMPF